MESDSQVKFYTARHHRQDQDVYCDDVQKIRFHAFYQAVLRRTLKNDLPLKQVYDVLLQVHDVHKHFLRTLKTRFYAHVYQVPDVFPYAVNHGICMLVQASESFEEITFHCPM